MFQTVLVANRGEISCRVIATLREMGIRSIAVYSEADAGAKHVRDADASVCIGPASAEASYLNIDAIIEAAVSTGAEAIHPGYGFLSESAELARACARTGIVFIGPGEHALDVMGDKIRSKNHVAAAGVPVIPGVTQAGLDDDELCALAETIGFPLLVKPSAGGGGKGMHRAANLADLRAALPGVRRVARAAFGDETVLLERYLDAPRHIEVQIFADETGSVIHLGERECSLQRRHQKVIEEAPSPMIDQETRESLGHAACEAARSVDYVGAGTVEFLVEASAPDDFYFIEMNTRLQVEHPVTEMITGLDLVRLQILIAAGLPLPVTQDDVRFRGHAVEARVYAESPARGFLPATGRVLALQEPVGVRVDSALIENLDIASDYDPLLAKIIAWAPNRAQAIERLDAALAETIILGVDTNVSFMRSLLARDDVRAGQLSTFLIDTLADFAEPELGEQARETLSVAAFDALGGDKAAAKAPWTTPNGWRLGAAAVPRVRVHRDNGQVLELEAHASGAAPDGACAGCAIAVDEDGFTWVHGDGHSWRVRLDDGRTRVFIGTNADAPASDTLRAAMPGTVGRVDVADGDTVTQGQVIVVIEAMKMEHPVLAPREGTVRLDVEPGAHVRRDQIVARLDPMG